MKLSNKKFTTEEILEFLDALEGHFMVGCSGNQEESVAFIPTDRIGMAGFTYFTLGRSRDGKVIVGKPSSGTPNMFGEKFGTPREAAERFNKYAAKRF